MPSGIIVVVLMFISLILLVQYGKRSRDQNLRRIRHFGPIFREIGKKFELTGTEGRVWGENSRTLYVDVVNLCGTVHGVDLEIQRQLWAESGSPEVSFHVKHEIPVEPFGYMRLYNETKATTVMRGLGAGDFTIGDPGFDDVVLMKPTREHAAVALMCREARDHIGAIARRSRSFEISNSWMKIHVGESGITDAASLGELIELVAATSRLLTASSDLTALLGHNLLNDPLPAVRMKNLHCLMTHCPTDGRTADLLRRALSHQDLDLQIEAAGHLDGEGMAHLMVMLDSPSDSSQERRSRIIELLKMKKHRASGDLLRALYAAHDDISLRVQILAAFEAFGDPALCPFLLKELEQGEPLVRSQVIAALASCGTVAAVEPLLAIVRHPRHAAEERDARDAIARIQARLGNVDSGWLSVAEMKDTQGGLSLADGAREGALSVPDDEKGGPSA